MTRSILLSCTVVVCLAGAGGAEDLPAAHPGAANAQTVPSAPVAVPSTPPVPSPQALPPCPSPSTVPGDGCSRLARLCCNPCGPTERGWIQADYLLWSVQSGGVPALVVRDLPGTTRSAVGLPTTPGQQVLFGGARQTGDLRSGLRLGGGYWLDECRHWAIRADFLYLASGNDGGTFASPGDPPLSRPFLNTATGRPDAELVSFPGVLAGSVSVGVRNTFVGAGLFLQRNLCCAFDACDPCGASGYRIDLLAGYRYYGLNDDLLIRENLLAPGSGAVPPGTVLAVADRFHTENTFNGGLLGLSGGARYGKWVLDFCGGAALGAVHRELVVDGNTVVQVPGQTATVRSGGLLAQRSNVGAFSSDTFTVAPEAGLNVGYQLTPGVSAHVGYTFVYLPNVWRAGDQIDRGVDPAQLRGATSALGRPAPVLASTGAVIQGINFGLTFRY